MVDIPTNKNIIKNKKVNTQMQTETGSRLTPTSNFTMPVTEGASAIKIVDNVSQLANKLADKQAINIAYDKGLKAQKQAGTDYVAKQGTAFTLTGEAFQKGANLAFTNSKQLELSKELKQIATDNPLDVEKYNTLAEEYKTKWSEDLPSNLQGLLTEKFDTSKAKFETDILINKKLDERQQQVITHTDKFEQTLQKIIGSIENNDLESLVNDDVGLPAYFNEVLAEFQQFGSVYQVGAKTTDAMKTVASELIATAILTKEYENADLKSREKIKEQINMGTYNFGELGEAYKDYIPGGLKFGATTTAKLLATIQTLDDDIYKKFKEERSVKDTSLSTQNKEIESGKGFAVKKLNNVHISKEWLEQEKYIIDEQELVALGYKPEEIETIKKQRAESLMIGQSTWLATVGPVSHSTGLITKIEEQLTALNTSTEYSAQEKVTLRAVYKKQIAAIQKVQNEKIKILNTTGGDGVAEYVIKNLGIGANEDLFSADGLTKFVATASNHFNTPHSLVNMMPLNVANTVTGSIFQATSADQMLQNISNNKMQYKEHFNSLIKKASRSSDDIKFDGLLAVADILDSDQNKARNFADGLINYETNLQALEGKLPADVTKKASAWITDEVEAKYNSGGIYHEQTHGDSDLGKSHRAMYQVMFVKYYALHGDTGKAHKFAEAEMDTAYVTIEFENGASGIFSKAGAPDETAINEIKLTVTDMLTNPARYGAITGDADGYHDFIKNSDSYLFVSKNGGIQILDKHGTQVMWQKLPSAQEDYVYGDFIVTPPGFRKAPAAYEDGENTWHWGKQLNLKTNEFEKNYDPLEFVETYDETGIDGFNRTKSVNEKMIEYTQHMNKTIPLEDRAKYNDWVIDQLDPEPARWGLPLKAISLAMANGDLKDWHLEWLGNNIPHLKKLRNGYARKKIMELYVESGTIPKPSANDAPHTMSPLQSLTVNVIDLQSEDYQYQATDAREILAP